MATKRKLTPVTLKNKAKLLDDLPIQSVSIDSIQLPAKQPRRYFDPDKLKQLTESIKSHGILEPLLVRPLKSERYELVAGERRLRAAQELDLDSVPVVSKPFNDQEAAHVALMENLQREDLNPVEETEGILELLALELELNHDQVASLIHRSKNAKTRGRELNHNVMVQLEIIETVLSQVGKFNLDSFRANRLPLLTLPDEILETLRQGQLEYTKAIAISRVKDDSQRHEILQEAIADNLSLAQIRSRIQALQITKTKPNHHVKIVKRYKQIGKKIQHPKILKNADKRKRLNELLGEIEDLLTADQ